MSAIYVDSSALVKLVAEEPESAALRRHLRKRPVVSSAIARTEVLRGLLAGGEALVARGRALLLGVELVRVNDRILSAAGLVLPVTIRSLDAIHLATAAQLGSDVTHLVTYDVRMAEAAQELGLKTSSPR